MNSFSTTPSHQRTERYDNILGLQVRDAGGYTIAVAVQEFGMEGCHKMKQIKCIMSDITYQLPSWNIFLIRNIVFKIMTKLRFMLMIVLSSKFIKIHILIIPP